MNPFVLSVLLVSLVLSGCSTIFGDTFSDRAQDYIEAEEHPRMKQVAGQSELPIQDRYSIPEIVETEASAIKVDEDGDFIVPQPLVLIVEDEQDLASLAGMVSDDLNPRLERDGAGTLVLRLDGQFGVAWTAVAEALASSDYSLTDLNRSIGTYYITIFDPTAEPEDKSFWQWLTRSNQLGADVDYLLKMNRSRLGVYLSLQKDVETLADDMLSENFLTDLQKLLEK
jgi:outer membrane protein assembly factor BamC